MDMINMGVIYKVLGICMALSLAPYVYKLLQSSVQKPVINLISKPELIIGFTTSGPVINLDLGFSTKNKDAIVEKIELTLVHESNVTHRFEWKWYAVTTPEMEFPKFVHNPFEESQKDLVLRLQRDSFIFQRISFREISFQDRYQPQIDKASDLYNKISALKDEDNRRISVDRVNSKLVELFNRSFTWITGDYKAKIEVFTRENMKSFEHEFSFNLQDTQKEELEKNITECAKSTRISFFDKEKDFKPEWEWVKIVRRVNEM